MNSKLEKQLYEKYPKIFRQKDLPMTQTCMCWGVETGDGWYWLINNLCRSLQSDTDYNNAPQIEAVQVKEKFGTLRFYVNGANEETNAVIDFAEMLSASICEACGATGAKQNETGWIQTLCDKCRKDSVK